MKEKIKLLKTMHLIGRIFYILGAVRAEKGDPSKYSCWGYTPYRISLRMWHPLTWLCLLLGIISDGLSNIRSTVRFLRKPGTVFVKDDLYS